MGKLVGGFVVLMLLVAGLTAWVYHAGRPSQPSPAQYVAMGSSYASGPGITERAPDSPVFCGRSKDNYAHQLARLRGLTLVDVTCGGAQTKHILDGKQFLQPAQLDALRPETTLVTLTIGGNDIAYAANLMAYGCALHHQWYLKIVQALFGCWSMPDAEVAAKLKTLPARFDRIAQEVHRRSPHARLVMLTYQTVLPATGTCPRLGMTDAQADHMRATATALADVTRAAAERNGAVLFDAAAVTAAHDVCAADPWMSDQQAIVPLHTTLAGMTAIARGLDEALAR